MATQEEGHIPLEGHKSLACSPPLSPSLLISFSFSLGGRFNALVLYIHPKRLVPLCEPSGVTRVAFGLKCRASECFVPCDSSNNSTSTYRSTGRYLYIYIYIYVYIDHINRTLVSGAATKIARNTPVTRTYVFFQETLRGNLKIVRGELQTTTY